jgi:hypothetical protein
MTKRKCMQDKFEYTKRIIESVNRRTSQYNDQKKKDKSATNNKQSIAQIKKTSTKTISKIVKRYEKYGRKVG